MNKCDTKTLVKTDVHPLDPMAWTAMKEQATMLVKSGFLPQAVNTVEKAIAIALSGRELGIGFMESLRSINVIQAKPTISPQLMLALANRTGELENIEIVATDDKCTVNIKRKGRTPYVNEFGVKEAKDLGLLDKDNYRKQKKTMFQWRALAANLRVTFPDVVLGLYTPEELGADVRVGDHGTMEVVDLPPAQAVKPEPVSTQPETRKDEPMGKPRAFPTDTYAMVPNAIETRVSKTSKKTYWAIQDEEGVKYYSRSEPASELIKKYVGTHKPVQVTVEDSRFGLEILNAKSIQ